MFQTKIEQAKKQNRGKSPGQVLKRSSSSASNSPVSKKSCVIKSGLGRPNTDLILVNKAGRPVRREGPKWEPERLEKDTLFILGSRANKVGFAFINLEEALEITSFLYEKDPHVFLTRLLGLVKHGDVFI